MSEKLLDVEEDNQIEFINIIRELKLGAKRLGTIEINFDFNSKTNKNFKAHAWTFFQKINSTPEIPNKYVLKSMNKKSLYQYFLMSIYQIFNEKKINIKTFNFGSSIRLKSKNYKINCKVNNNQLFKKLLNDIKTIALNNEVKINNNSNLFNLN